MNRFTLAGLALFFAICNSTSALAEPAQRVASVFADNMVIQRDMPILVWGEANAGESIEVSLKDQRAVAVADTAGRWQAELSALPAGGPYVLTVAGSEGTERFENVLIGDVFLCSGQSNMEYPLRRALNPDQEMNSARGLRLRLVTVGKDKALSALSDFDKRLVWTVPEPETVKDFSAVCFLAGRDVARSEGVPVGLIHSSWGGSQIEAWMDLPRLEAIEAYAKQTGMLRQFTTDRHAAFAAYGDEIEEWLAKRLPDQPALWQGEVTNWKAAPKGLGSYTDWGAREYFGRTGLIWYRSEFHVTREQLRQAPRLELGVADDSDFVWVNGKFVGADIGYGLKRSYPLPKDALKAGTNELLVGVINRNGGGGLLGPEDAIRLEFEGGLPSSVPDGWTYWWSPGLKRGFPPRAPWSSTHGYSTLHNAMIAPLGPIGLKGVAWYQGESNVGQGMHHKRLLHDLSALWRDQFRSDELPVYVVQLPGFGALSAGPAGSAWADLREAQRHAALEDPNMALIGIIDAGDRHDIHPPNKQIVAERLAASIRKLSYGHDIVTGGAAPSSASLEADNDAVLVRFDNVGEGLLAAGGLAGPFELCGPDGECLVVPTELNGTGAVRLLGASAKDASKVRYCWADAPICTLFTKDGYPVGPFEVTIN